MIVKIAKVWRTSSRIWRKVGLCLFLATITMYLILSISMKLEHRGFPAEVKELSEPGEWLEVKGARLSDIAGIGFDGTGKYGAAVSSEGKLLVTRDGGNSWQFYKKVPIDLSEIVSSLAVSGAGRIAVGAGVDESAYTTLYLMNGDDQEEWEAKTGNYGGIGGASADGSIFVGGNGLFSIWNGKEWMATQLPVCGQVMLYGAARDKQKVIVVGDQAVVAQSEDSGETWNCTTLESVAPSPLYSVAIASAVNAAGAANDIASLAGGAGGKLWRFDGERWNAIKAVSADISIYAIYLRADGKAALIGGGDDASAKTTLLYTNDGGKSWQPEITNKNYGKIVAIAKGKDRLYAGTSDGHILARKLR